MLVSAHNRFPVEERSDTLPKTHVLAGRKREGNLLVFFQSCIFSPSGSEKVIMGDFGL